MFTLMHPDTKVQLLDDVEELRDVTEAMRRAVTNGNELRLQDHVVHLHELNLRLAKRIELQMGPAVAAPVSPQEADQ